MSKNRQEKKDKKKLLLTLLLLLTFGVGLGYSVLSQQLSINNTVNYGSMKWNIGFTAANNNNGSVTAIPTVSADKKTVTVQCDLGTSTKSETCKALATVKNDSTFKIKLTTEPTITFDENYIESVKVQFQQQEQSRNLEMSNSSLSAGQEIQYLITITTKELSEGMLPNENLSLPVTITLNWGQEQ